MKKIVKMLTIGFGFKETKCWQFEKIHVISEDV